MSAPVTWRRGRSWRRTLPISARRSAPLVKLSMWSPRRSSALSRCVASLVSGRHRAETTDLVVCTPVQVYGDAERLGYIEAIEFYTVLTGTCSISNMREIARQGAGPAFSNSAKIVNILGGYG